MIGIVSGIDTLIACAGVGLARTVPITYLVPALGGHHLPAPLRVGLGMSMALLVLPALVPGVSAFAAVAGPAGWALLLGREVLVGLTVGLVASFVFRAAEMAGRLADVLRGANFAEVISPAAEERTSALGSLYVVLAVLIFLEMGGAGAVASALARSYEAVPVGAALHASSLRQAGVVVATASARLVEAGVGLAAPVVVTFLLLEVALGLVARLAPQIPVYFVAMPMKALLGVGVVLFGLGALELALAGELRAFIGLIGRTFAAWK